MLRNLHNLKLVDDWQDFHKWASVRLAAFMAIIAGVLTANSTLVLGLLSLMPSGILRAVLVAFVVAVVFIVPVLTRIVCKAPAIDETDHAGA